MKYITLILLINCVLTGVIGTFLGIQSDYETGLKFFQVTFISFILLCISLIYILGKFAGSFYGK